MSEKEIWDKVLEIAQERISNTSYQTFIKDTQLYSLKNDEAIILVSLPFNASWLNQRY
jgi:chromosomal replication initiator protein DnaA